VGPGERERGPLPSSVGEVAVVRVEAGVVRVVAMVVDGGGVGVVRVRRPLPLRGPCPQTSLLRGRSGVLLAGGGAGLCWPRRRSSPERSAKLSRKGVVRHAAGTPSAWVGRVAGWVLAGEPKNLAQRPRTPQDDDDRVVVDADVPARLDLCGEPSRARKRRWGRGWDVDAKPRHTGLRLVG